MVQVESSRARVERFFTAIDQEVAARKRWQGCPSSVTLHTAWLHAVDALVETQCRLYGGAHAERRAERLQSVVEQLVRGW
jgi:hypothetical protein